jgi:hypothetical protein
VYKIKSYYNRKNTGIFKESMGARDRVAIGFSYLPARLHIAGGIYSLESISGLFKSLKIRALGSEFLIDGDYVDVV